MFLLHEHTSMSFASIGPDDSQRTMLERMPINNKLHLVVFIILVLCLLLYYTNLDWINSHIGQLFKLKSMDNIFKPINTNGIFTLHNVCIELKPGSENIVLTPDKMVAAKRIVMYNAHQEDIINLTVATSHDSHFKHWSIYQTKKSIPMNHTYITEQPAYFSTPSIFGNLYHFWRDLYVGLYGVLSLTNRLGASDGNYLYFSEYTIRGSIKVWSWFNKNYNKERYSDFIYALGILPGYGVFFNETANTCFRNAVFGSQLTKWQDVVKYIISKFPFDFNKCKAQQITIIQRSQRRILNVDELQKAVVELGFSNTSIVDLAEMSVLQQYQLIRCTRVLIGINGAGLQWAIFMKPKRGILELSFGKHNFKTTYHTFKQDKGFVYNSLNASNVIPDRFDKFSKKQQEDIMSGKKNIAWKFSDGIFESECFKAKLKIITDEIFKT